MDFEVKVFRVIPSDHRNVPPTVEPVERFVIREITIPRAEKVARCEVEKRGHKIRSFNCTPKGFLAYVSPKAKGRR